MGDVEVLEAVDDLFTDTVRRVVNTNNNNNSENLARLT